MHAKQVADVLPQHYYDFCGRVYEVVDEDPVRFEKEGLVCPYKFEVFTNDLVLLEELRAQLTEMGLAISSAFTNNLEIMSKGMGKGPAIRWLANYLGAEFDECMAFGDNTNDLDMLTNVGWPIAVDNAVPVIKAVAREITDACADDGVANYIFKNVLGAK